MKKRKIVLLAALLVPSVTLLLLFPEEDTRYEIIDLGVVSGNMRYAGAFLNDLGQVAGNPPFLWIEEEGRMDLTPPNGPFKKIGGVNDRGEIIGSSVDPLLDRNAKPKGEAVIWSPSEGSTRLGKLGGRLSIGNAINDRGEAVGRCVVDGTKYASFPGFIWSATDGTRRIEVPNPPITGRMTPTSINNLGEILISKGGGRGACVWDGATECAISVLASDESRILPADMNDRGFVVGYTARDGDFQIARSFVWNATAGRIDLSRPEKCSCWAFALNNHNRVVGCWILHPSTVEEWMDENLSRYIGRQKLEDSYVAVIWENGEGTPLIDMIPSRSGWDSLEFATDINDHGQIVGTGTKDGETHVFLLTPVQNEEPPPEDGGKEEDAEAP